MIGRALEDEFDSTWMVIIMEKKGNNVEITDDRCSQDNNFPDGYGVG